MNKRRQKNIKKKMKAIITEFSNLNRKHDNKQKKILGNTHV